MCVFSSTTAMPPPSNPNETVVAYQSIDLEIPTPTHPVMALPKFDEMLPNTSLSEEPTAPSVSKLKKVKTMLEATMEMEFGAPVLTQKRYNMNLIFNMTNYSNKF